MKFDTIIIGGGLSGVTTGITLARAGQRVAIFSTGQSALQFSSGSMELLNNVGGHTVEHPTEAFDELPAEHPYRRIGKEKWLELLGRVQPLMSEAGISTMGDSSRNRWRLTPLGKLKPAWLTLDDFATFDSPQRLPWRSVSLVNITDFQDFYPQFLAPTLEQRGVICRMNSVTIPRLEELRKSSSEMRAPTVARLLDDDAIRQIAGRLNVIARDVDALIMPAVVGLRDDHQLTLLRRLMVKPVYFITTMPASVPGIRIQMLLDAYFKKLGGTLMPGDTIIKADFNGDKIRAVFSLNHGEEPLEADNYVLASGSFFGNGLVALPDSIVEPILGLDIDAPTQRADWYRTDLYESQPFMAYGVRTDESFRPSVSGRTIQNLYAVGSVLGGCNPIKEGCGAGVAILTAMAVAESILEQTHH